MSIATVPLPDVHPQLYIDGSWQDANSGETFEVLAPATGEPLLQVASAGADDIDQAVAAARREVDGGRWSRLTGAERGVLLGKLADLIERDLETLVTLEAHDIGRPAYEPRAVDIPCAADVFRHFSGWADKIEGRAITPAPAFGRQRLAYTRREPLGVVGAICAWNAPTMIAAWKLAPSLAAGNAVVLKPAEDAPLSTLHLAALIEEAGFPPGAISILPGLGEVAGAALASHPGVDKITFTGSPEVGREIAIQAARDHRRVTLELGGKSPQIILADANLEEVLPGVVGAFTANQGEICAAGTRVLVARKHHEALLAEMADAMGAIHLGEPFDPDTTMGALINERQRDRVMSYIERGNAEGARLVAGGSRPSRPGFFVEPTLFAGTDNAITIAREEIFGPVALVMPFEEEAEAVSLANDTRYGLGAYIWTRDISRAHELAAQIRAGSVWINGAGAPDARLPWGGFKMSGTGRELGWAGIESSTEEKTITITL